MDHIIDLARQLGQEIQKDERYIRAMDAQKKADEDEQLQKDIGEFNLKRIALNNEMQKEDRSDEKIDELSAEIREIYEKIMNSDSMKNFNEVKPELDQLINFVARIITLSAQGEDPNSIEEHSASCSGDCGSCGGCH